MDISKAIEEKVWNDLMLDGKTKSLIEGIKTAAIAEIKKKKTVIVDGIVKHLIDDYIRDFGTDVLGDSRTIEAMIPVMTKHAGLKKAIVDSIIISIEDMGIWDCVGSKNVKAVENCLFTVLKSSLKEKP